MDCKEFEKNIPAFVNDNMEYKVLKQFLEHFEKCPECREELTIQVLVHEGIARLEEGNAFDLQGELKRRVDEAEMRIRMRKSLKALRITLYLLALWAVAAVFTLFVL